MYSKEGEYDGRIVQFSIFQCNISNSTKHWYISIVPTNGNPGTSSDIDFYSAPVTEHCRYLPPQDGWVKSNEGKDPSPLLVFRSHRVQQTPVHYPPPMRPPRQSVPLQKVQRLSSRHSEKPNASSRRLVVVVEEEHATKTSRSGNKVSAAERYYDAKPQHQSSPSMEARSNPLQQAYQHTRNECDPQSFEDQLLDRVFVMCHGMKQVRQRTIFTAKV